MARKFKRIPIRFEEVDFEIVKSAADLESSNFSEYVRFVTIQVAKMRLKKDADRKGQHQETNIPKFRHSTPSEPPTDQKTDSWPAYEEAKREKARKAGGDQIG